MKILIVDDDPLICDALKKALEVEGFTVLVAHAALEAADIMRTNEDVRIALIDWNLGGTMNGSRLARALRRMGRGTFMMSGYSREQIREDWRDPLEGLLGFYSKGDPDFLDQVVGDLLRAQDSFEETEP